MKINTNQPILSLLADLGLTITKNSGGFYDPNHTYRITSFPRIQMLSDSSNDTNLKPIKFYNGTIFLKSLEVTEKTLNVKLFV
tara:strand:- start:433 stop:681 length:249 start_codon:yes stop_codon:yes gene_type:complete